MKYIKYLGINGQNLPFFFPNKKVKELKNHFHACLIKTARRTIHQKFEPEFIEIVRCFYSINALLNLIKEPEINDKKIDDISTSNSIIKLRKSKIKNKRKDNKYNPKRLIFSGELTIDMLIKYQTKLINEVLLKKPEITLFLSSKNKLLNFEFEEVSWLFSIVIKSKLIYKCKQYIKCKNINNDYIKIISEYIKDNSSIINENFEDY